MNEEEMYNPMTQEQAREALHRPDGHYTPNARNALNTLAKMPREIKILWEELIDDVWEEKSTGWGEPDTIRSAFEVHQLIEEKFPQYYRNTRMEYRNVSRH